MKSCQRVIICVMLIVSVFAMSSSVLAVDPTPIPTPVNGIPGMPDEQMAIYYIWLTLKAWGIDVTIGDVEEYTDDVSVWLLQQVYDYLDTLPSQTSLPQWTQPWMWQSDYWGYIQGNSSFLEDCQDFAEYLVIKFSLVNNDEYTDYIHKVVINDVEYPVYTIDYRTTYNNRWYVTGATTNNDGLPITNDSYFYISTGYVAHLYFATSSSNWYFEILDANGNLVYTGVSWYGSASDEFELQFYHNINSQYTTQPYALLQVSGLSGNSAQGPAYFTTNQFYEYFLSGISIKTSVIALPDDDPSYTPGDSITIVDGEPLYVVVEWPESVSVDNLPAIVSKSTVENPHLEEAYRPIQGLIEYAKDGISLCTALLYELPDEMVYMWYAVIASLIIWGMIKLMREH